MFLAGSFAADPSLIGNISGNHLAAELLDGASAGYGRAQHLIDLIGKASDARAQVIHLAITLAGYEESTGREDWRTRRVTTARYLRYLADLGYELSAVEQLAIG